MPPRSGAIASGAVSAARFICATSTFCFARSPIRHVVRHVGAAKRVKWVVLGLLAACGSGDVVVGTLDQYRGLWARTAGGGGEDLPWSADVDDEGNQYVVGTFRDSIDLGGQRHEAQGPTGPTDPGLGGNIFIVSYTRDGAYRWWHAYGGSLFTFSEHVVVSGPRVHAVGEFRGQMKTDAGAIDSGPFQGLVLLTHDRAGKFLSAVHVSGERNVQGKRISPSPDGQRLLV